MSYQHPLVIADHFRLAKAYRLLGDDESVSATLKRIDCEEIGESSFKTRNKIDSHDFHIVELRWLGWSASDIWLTRQGKTVTLGIEYKKAPETTFKLYRKSNKSEFDELKADPKLTDFELIKSIPYEITGTEYVVSLWHKKAK